MAISVMSVGLGLVVMMFTLVNGFMWSDVGLSKKETLYHLEWERIEGVRMRVEAISVHDYKIFREESKTFEHLIGYNTNRPSFAVPNSEVFPDRYDGARVSYNFFDALNMPPQLGRGFTKEDVAEGADRVAIISHFLWQEQLGGNTDVIGKQVLINGDAHTIVGIMPLGFAFPERQDMWLPTEWPESIGRDRNRSPYLEVIGYLRSGYSLDQAQTELNTISERIATSFPDTNADKTRIDFKTYNDEVLGRDSVQILYLMLFCAFLVLLISCANVSNLIMARASRRLHELAIRNAVGASRKQLLGQVVLDGFMISIVGSLFGLLIARWGCDWMWQMLIDNNLPYWWHLNFDIKVVSFVLGAAILATLVSSIIPALRASRIDNFDILKDDSRTSSSLFIGKLSKLLTSFQIALSGALLLTALSMILITHYITNRPLPYEPERILTARIQLNAGGGFPENSDVKQFYDNLKRNLDGQDGIDAIGFTTAFNGMGAMRRRFEIEGIVYDQDRDDARPLTMINAITDGFMDVFKLELLEGRAFQLTDTADTQKVCLVNKSFDQSFFPQESALGKRILIKGNGFNEYGWVTVVGVVPDLRASPLPGTPRSEIAEIFLPFAQRISRGMSVMITGKGDPHRWIPVARNEIRMLSPVLAPQSPFRTMEEVMDIGQAGLNIVTRMFGIFGLVALFKASVGLYAVISLSARQKKREFGIRMALGANGNRIARMVLQQNYLQVGISLLLGVLLGHAISNFLKGTLDMGNFTYPAFIYFVTVIVILFFNFLASGIPALRTSKIDPIQALRTE